MPPLDLTVTSTAETQPTAKAATEKALASIVKDLAQQLVATRRRSWESPATSMPHHLLLPCFHRHCKSTIPRAPVSILLQILPWCGHPKTAQESTAGVPRLRLVQEQASTRILRCSTYNFLPRSKISTNGVLAVLAVLACRYRCCGRGKLHTPQNTIEDAGNGQEH